jgi:excinuclease ABC subunit B
MYADRVTGSMQRMIALTQHRRRKQLDYNQAHSLVPQAIRKEIQESLRHLKQETEELDERIVCETGEPYDLAQTLREIEREMLDASEKLEFERAALLRDQLYELKATLNPQQPVSSGKISYVGRRVSGKKNR